VFGRISSSVRNPRRGEEIGLVEGLRFLPDAGKFMERVEILRILWVKRERGA
jgi:hypothetical protein